MARPQHIPTLQSLEKSITVLFCLIDDAYACLNPHGERYGALKKLSDSEVLTLALFQQLRGVESERSFLRDVRRFFAYLFPGAAGSGGSGACSFLLQPARVEAQALPGISATRDPPRVGGRTGDSDRGLDALGSASSAPGFSGGGLGERFVWRSMGKVGTFSVYGVKLHLLRATNRVPISTRAFRLERRRTSVLTCSVATSFASSSGRTRLASTGATHESRSKLSPAMSW